MHFWNCVSSHGRSLNSNNEGYIYDIRRTVPVMMRGCTTLTNLQSSSRVDKMPDLQRVELEFCFQVGSNN